MQTRFTPLALAVMLAVATPAAGADIVQIVTPLSHPDHPLIPQDARNDQCFAHEITPAVIETTTHKTQTAPPRLAVDIKTGETEVIREATYETVTVRKVLREREEIFFETLCPQLYTQRFVESLQRALAARGFYASAPSGWMDEQTLIAIRMYQKLDGLPSSILSLRTVESFGLVAHSDFRGVTGN